MTKKYIDANSLRKEIEKNKNMIDGLFAEGDDSVYDGENDAYNRVLRIIDSLQQEQPFLPDNLDEEAHNWAMKDSVVYISRKKSFKAGAEWMAKQMNNDN